MAAGILERIVAKLVAIMKRRYHCPSKYLMATRRSVIIQMDAQSPETVTEGAKKTVVVNKYERDPAARNMCIAKWGVRCCSVCGFNFEERYGALGKGFIHVHHLKPLSEIGEEYELILRKGPSPGVPKLPCYDS